MAGTMGGALAACPSMCFATRPPQLARCVSAQCGLGCMYRTCTSILAPAVPLAWLYEGGAVVALLLRKLKKLPGGSESGIPRLVLALPGAVSRGAERCRPKKQF